MKLCVIGLGKMGSALVSGILNSGIYKPEDIIGCDLNVEPEDANKNFGGILTTNDNVRGAKEADIILLSVKPQVIDMILAEIKDNLAEKLVISIVAGVSISHINNILAKSSLVVRVMPNTPVLVKEGISAIAPGDNITDKEIKVVKNIFEAVGEVIEVDEKLMDAVTGLSGSGPAYIYMIIEALADGGVRMGISRELAIKLAAQTVLGSAKMVLETGKHPGELKDMVTSPGGTTIQGVEKLEMHGLRGILIDAVKAATERSRELSEHGG